MSERSEMVADFKSAFDTDLLEATTEITVVRYSRDAYDTETGSSENTVLNTEITRGIFSGPWVEEKPAGLPIQPDDETLLIIKDELSFVPDVGTEIQTTTQTFKVLQVVLDSFTVMWQLRVRT